MKIVILGYSGLVGRSILERLVKNTSFYIICVGRNIDHKPYKNPRIEYFKWNFKLFKKSDLIFLTKAKVIINCVGKTDNKEDFEYINVLYIQKLLKFIVKYDFKIRLIHLSSVAVYGRILKNFGQNHIMTENSSINAKDLYSKSKLKGDLLIQNVNKKKLYKNFTYTILRVSNVVGGKKKSNLFKFIKFSLKFSFWIKCYDDIIFNFINVKDVSLAVILCISNLNISKNKIYIVSDDYNQHQLYKSYENFYLEKIKKINVSINLIKFIINFLPLPKKVKNFIYIISNRISYSNKKIKKELKFKPKYSFHKKIYLINE